MINRKQLEEKILQKPTVFILGAGLSTSSGISDFKSLQKQFDTTELLSTEAYQNQYWLQHDFIAKYLMVSSKPNLAHKWLAKLCMNPNIKLISQNIDSLLEKAGVMPQSLLKIHGTLDKFINKNGESVSLSIASYKNMSVKTGDYQKVRPDIVFYGEPVKNFDIALNWVNQAQNIVVIGTRLNVFPVNQLVLTGQQMTNLFIINNDHINIATSSKVKIDQINESIDTWIAN